MVQPAQPSGTPFTFSFGNSIPLQEKAAHQRPEAYIDQLIQLIDSPLIEKHPELKSCLESLAEDIMTQDTAELSPQQKESYKWFQKLVTDGKVSDFVSRKLQQFAAASRRSLETLSPRVQTCTTTMIPTASILPPPPLPPRQPVPSMAFGAAEWERYFGYTIAEPPLPPNIEEILKRPCRIWKDKTVQETHLLTLVPAEVDGQPFNLKLLQQLVENPLEGNGTGLHSPIHSQDFADPISTTRWVLMTKEIIPESNISSPESYPAQQKIVRNYPGYQVPKVLDVATSILMEYVRNNTPLYNEKTYTLCQDHPFHNDWKVIVGGFSHNSRFTISNFSMPYGVDPRVIGAAGVFKLS
jgi:hypothetical protein